MDNVEDQRHANSPPPYKVEAAFPNLKFEMPTSLTEPPGHRWMVSEIGGKIFTFKASDREVQQRDALLEIEDVKIWHATVHPKFEVNGFVFVCYSKDGTSHVSRFIAKGKPLKTDPNSEAVLLTWPAGGHNGGCIRFGTDGMLYDDSGPNPPDGLTAAQDVSNLFGCVLRIDVDKKADENSTPSPKTTPS